MSVQTLLGCNGLLLIRNGVMQRTTPVLNMSHAQWMYLDESRRRLVAVFQHINTSQYSFPQLMQQLFPMGVGRVVKELLEARELKRAMREKLKSLSMIIRRTQTSPSPHALPAR